MINKKRPGPGSEMLNIKNMGCRFFYSSTLSPVVVVVVVFYACFLWRPVSGHGCSPCVFFFLFFRERGEFVWNVDLTTRPGAEHLYVLFVLGEKELNLVIKLPRRLDIDSEDSLTACLWLNKVVHRSLRAP